MTALTLVIGNRNYSSWSLRPWALLTHLGLPFGEILLELDTPTFGTDARRYSPTGRLSPGQKAIRLGPAPEMATALAPQLRAAAIASAAPRISGRR